MIAQSMPTWYFLAAMTLFTLLAVPLGMFLLGLLFYSDRCKTKKYWTTLLKGLMVFIPFMVVLFLFPESEPPFYNLSALYLFFWLKDFFFYQMGAVGLFFLFFGFSFKRRKKIVQGMDRENLLLHVSAFFTGFFTLTGLIDIVLHYGWYDVYVLFLLPTTRIALIIGTSLLMTKMLFFDRYWKIPFVVAAIALPSLAASVSLTFYANHTAWGILITGVLLIGAVACFSFLHKKVVV